MFDADEHGKLFDIRACVFSCKLSSIRRWAVELSNVYELYAVSGEKNFCNLCDLNVDFESDLMDALDEILK